MTSLVADLGFALILENDRDLTAEDLLHAMSSTDFDTVLTDALADSVSLRERFRRVATTGFMVLRNPVGRRRKVGGHAWAERRLFEQMRSPREVGSYSSTGSRRL